jgi:hypothetical protein
LQQAVRHRNLNPDDQQWLDEFRHEYNNKRPHEALAMATPASRWRPSSRPFQAITREWQYPLSMPVLRLGGEGQLCWRGQRWESSRALRNQLVGIEVIDDRALVYFCNTPMRDLDLKTGTAAPIPANIFRSLPD